jgi:hypothetical protein
VGTRVQPEGWHGSRTIKAKLAVRPGRKAKGLFESSNKKAELQIMYFFNLFFINFGVFMKKITAFLAVLMIMGFTGVASAASLAWDTATMPVGSTVTLDNSPTISASFGFGLNKGTFSHDYTFSSIGSSLPGQITGLVIGLLNDHLGFTNLSIDGNPMTWDAANQRWFGLGDILLNHVLHVEGNVTAIGQGYLVTVSEAPIPAAIWLFGSALAGLMGFSTRKTRAKALAA